MVSLRIWSNAKVNKNKRKRKSGEVFGDGFRHHNSHGMIFHSPYFGRKYSVQVKILLIYALSSVSEEEKELHKNVKWVMGGACDEEAACPRIF
jgi:hypothetical protein